jgi:hypothetical protein
MVSRTGKQKPSDRPTAVVGVADHNGWAILVSAAAVNGTPTVIDRRRVELIAKGVPSQPYHHETLALRDDESEQLLRRVKRSIAACAELAFERLSDDLSPHYRISVVAIRQAPLTDMPATVGEVHRSYYAQCRADGMLYHSAICAAARRRQWRVSLHRRGEELSRAGEAMRTSAQEVERFVSDLRQTLRLPWTAEYRHAFAAAIAELGRQPATPERIVRHS